MGKTVERVKKPYLSDAQKEVLKDTHEWLDAYVSDWAKQIFKRTGISRQTISVTMNAYKKNIRPNNDVLEAARKLLFEEKEKQDNLLNYAVPQIGSMAVEGLGDE